MVDVALEGSDKNPHIWSGGRNWSGGGTGGVRPATTPQHEGSEKQRGNSGFHWLSSTKVEVQDRRLFSRNTRLASSK